MYLTIQLVLKGAVMLRNIAKKFAPQHDPRLALVANALGFEIRYLENLKKTKPEAFNRLMHNVDQIELRKADSDMSSPKTTDRPKTKRGLPM